MSVLRWRLVRNKGCARITENRVRSTMVLMHQALTLNGSGGMRMEASVILATFLRQTSRAYYMNLRFAKLDERICWI
jgi:hypothetical protein